MVLIGSICVGIGEELFFRGILLTALRAHHSEFLALIVSSVLFGIAHVVGYLVAGLPLGLILFQVAFLSMNTQDEVMLALGPTLPLLAIGAGRPARRRCKLHNSNYFQDTAARAHAIRLRF